MNKQRFAVKFNKRCSICHVHQFCKIINTIFNYYHILHKSILLLNINLMLKYYKLWPSNNVYIIIQYNTLNNGTRVLVFTYCALNV